jgi:glutamate-5-semialdehyde dehydrogenase
LTAAAESIQEHIEEILDANRRDVAATEALVKGGKVTKPLLDRLRLDRTKILEISKMMATVSYLDDPVGRTLYHRKLDEGLDLRKVTVPFGVVLAIFESRPDALAQITALCIKAGNSVILKGGKEARESNACLYRLIKQSFVDKGLPPGCVRMVESRRAVGALLKAEGLIDLVVPRGSNELVRHIQDSTNIPVLGHSAGICHIYVDRTANTKMASDLCYDARVQYPAACNSMKILLIDKKAAEGFLPVIIRRLVDGGVLIKGCERTVEILKANKIPVEKAEENDWSTEYLDLTLPVKIVDGVDEAIEHINAYGSKHTDSIISEDMDAVERFLHMVDSSTVMHNASTRFSDGYRYGLGAEVGISTNKVHARGPVGLEGLVTTKYILKGSGHRVSDYVGRNARRFLHEKE